MSETIDQEGINENGQNLKKINQQQTETNEDLIENLHFKEKWGENDETSEEEFLNYYGYTNGNELKRIKDEEERWLDYMMITNEDLETFINKKDFDPLDDDSKFFIMSDTIKNHTKEEISERRNEIIKRRNNILILSQELRRFSLDILNDWEKIEKLWLTDDKLSTRDCMNLREIEELSGIYDLSQLENALKITREEIHKIIKIKETCGISSIYLENFTELIGLTEEDIQNIKNISKQLWIENPTANNIIMLKDLSTDVLEYCYKNKIKNTSQINLIKEIYSIRDKEKIKEYILRKKEYLQKNRTLSEDKYVEYFWKKWKHWKHDIQQWKFWLCYIYSVLETLKRMNWFDELIQTNLIENNKWRLVRLPFQTWTWIQVESNEIDKEYFAAKEIPDIGTSPEAELLKQLFGTTYYRRIKINSNTESLWIKILEIAYIKNILAKWRINKNEQGLTIDEQKFTQEDIVIWTWSIESPLDLKEINGDLLESIEWWDMIQSLKEIIWEKNLITWTYNVKDDIEKKMRLETLKKQKAPKTIIDNTLQYIWRNKKFKDISFDSFKSWFVTIHMSIDETAINKYKKWEKTKYKKFISTSDVEILEKNWNKIPKEQLQEKSDITINQKWNIFAKFFPHHAYSIEKCYTKESWEKRIWIVNPWHTEIKFDVPFERCADNFEREIWIIKIDNLFK